MMLSVLSVSGAEQRIGQVPGVESVTVNHAAGNATVSYDETRLEAAPVTPANVPAPDAPAFGVATLLPSSDFGGEQRAGLQALAKARATPVSERPGTQRKQIVHALPALRGQDTNAPHQFAPGLEAVFFSSRRMVSRLTGPIPARACAACSSKTKVQRLAPAVSFGCGGRA